MQFSFSESKDLGSLGSISSGSQRPSLSVYLNASTAAPKRASVPNNRAVQAILHDLDRIKRCKPRQRVQKCENLIYFIVQQLRKRRSFNLNLDNDEITAPKDQQEQYQGDHLLETTAIWALIHMLRLENSVKEIMIRAGVPGVLHDIMSVRTLGGSTRQYASELCFFLVTTQPMPESRHLSTMGPMLHSQLPEVHHNDRLYNTGAYPSGSRAYAVGSDDAISLAASEISSLADDQGLLPFVPYRINNENMAKLDSLFDTLSEDGYGNIGAPQENNAINTHPTMRRRSPNRGKTPGGTKKKRAELHSTVEMPSSVYSSRHGYGRTEHIGELDDHSISSSISSYSQSQEGAYSIADRLSGLIESQSMRNIRPWQSQSTLEHTLAGTVAQPGSSVSITSADSPVRQHSANKLFHMRATPEIAPPRRNGKPARSSTKGFLDKIISQSNAHFALDARLRGPYPNNPGGGSVGTSLDSFDGVPLDPLISPRSLADQSQEYAPSLTDQSYDLRSVGTAPSPMALYSPHSGMRHVRLASLDREADMLPANRLTSTTAGGFQGSRSMQMSGSKKKAKNMYGNTPSLDGMDRRASSSQSLRRERSIDSVSFVKSKASLTSSNEPSDINAFMAMLDPLSLNVSRGLHAHILDAPSSAMETNEDDETLYSRSDASEDEENDEFDNDVETWTQQNSHLKETSPDHYNTELGKIERKKALLQKKRMRIRAEKLIDHRFIKRLFNKKTTIKDTQDLIRRMQDLLELVDVDRSGYVTWEYFSRVLLGLAPKNLLRGDVVAFMDAQCDDSQALIDYREFVISGKVIVVQRQNGRSILPINGWLERQKLYSGDATTYTWKNHVKWYNARQSEAVIWLMRRATRAFDKSEQYVKVRKELLHIGSQAKAYDFLRLVSKQADGANVVRDESKRFLLARVMHARLRLIRVDEAFRYLSSLAFKVVKMEAIKEAVNEKLRAEEVFVDKVPQIGIERVYWIKFRNISTKEKLKWYGDRSIRHTVRKEQAFDWLCKYAKMVEGQLITRENAHEWLLRTAERYHAYCIIQDATLLSLLRIGAHGLRYLDRQIAGLDWLLHKGARMTAHVERQASTGSYLCVKGQRTLKFLNAREESFAHCMKRRTQAEVLIRRQRESIAFFRTMVQKIRNTEVTLQKAHNYLTARGRSAITYVNRRNQAFRRLVYISGRAHVVRRRVVNTFIDLQQIGQFARVANFNRYWSSMRENILRNKEEERRLVAFDSKVNATRKNLPSKERWNVELQDAFDTLAANLLLPGESVNDKKSLADAERTPLLTKMGFCRLVNQGALLGLKSTELDGAWLTIDPRSSGYTNFDDLWAHWFEEKAVAYHRRLIESKKKPRGFEFVLADILSPMERVFFIFKKRFAITEAKVARRTAEGAEESDEEEQEGEEEEEESEEESEEEEEAPEETVAEAQCTKTAQELEYDRLFMKMLGSEGLQEANTNEKSFEEQVLERSKERERRLERERLEREAAEVRAR